MSFLVEDGTGLTDSNSYVSVQEFRDYFTDKGTTFTQDDTTIQGWLVSGTMYADLNSKFSGTMKTATQALEWPRVDAWNYRTRHQIASDSIPKELKNGICELANLSGKKQLDKVIEKGVKSKSMGPVDITYGSAAEQQTSMSDFPQANNWLKYVSVRPNGRLIR